MDTKSSLIQSAKELKHAADQERINMNNIQKQLDQVKTGVQISHNHGINVGGTEDQMHNLERQVKDMQKGIEKLERQSNDMNRQAQSIRQ